MVELLLLALAVAPSSANCSGFEARFGCVQGGLRDDGADLLGQFDGGRDTTIDGKGGGGEDPAEKPLCAREVRGTCDFEFTIIPAPASAVTLSDIAHFAATPGEILTEPSGWAVIGLPLNAVSTATTHTVDGPLLGRSATVRFTPVGWSWDFGDGTTLRTSTGGARWRDLGVPEFDPTSSSHVYATRGTRTVTLVTDFRAEYRLDGGAWLPIPGTLSLPAAAPATVRAVAARTALVARDCRADPRGPGC